MFFTIPGSVHIWPNSAACWSPAMPAIGTGDASWSIAVSATMPLDGRTCGSIARGTRNKAKSASSQSSRWMSNSRVRAAFETSVTWWRPPVRFQTSQDSTVPKHSSPASARSRAPAMWSSIQAIFVAAK